MFSLTYFRESQTELNSLTRLIESMWTHYEPTVSPNNLNLDEMFSFLQEEKGLDNRGGGANKTLDEITDELNELNDLLTQDMVCIVVLRQFVVLYYV